MKTETNRLYELRAASRRFDISRLGQRLACRLWFAWLGYRRWRAARQAIRHLGEIDAYLLDDVGIHRAEIAAAVNGGKVSRHGAPRQPTGPRQAGRCNRLAA